MTYIIGVPAVAFVLAILLRGLTSSYVRKSIQLGFLFSVCVHLLLLILAVNVVIFSFFQPHASNGEEPKRSPIQKTVPEHLFQSPKETQQTPDWSKPVDATTTSRVIPKEQRQLPPVERSQPRLEMPKPRQPKKQPMQKFLNRAETAHGCETDASQFPRQIGSPGNAKQSTETHLRSDRRATQSSDVSAPAKASPTERLLANDPASSTSRRAPTKLDPINPRRCRISAAHASEHSHGRFA